MSEKMSEEEGWKRVQAATAASDIALILANVHPSDRKRAAKAAIRHAGRFTWPPTQICENCGCCVW